MRTSFIKHILCLLGAVLVMSGCYRDELADIHNQIDDLDLRTIREQIEGMKEGVANLQELQKWIEPAVESLQASKKAIEAEIDDLKARLTEAGAATEELKGELALKEARLSNVEKAIAGLESVSAALVERVKALEAAVTASTTGLSDRVMALETAWLGMATIEELADLEKYANDFSGDFGDNFFKSLEECKQQLSQWVSESAAIQQMFDQYYDCAFMDAEIKGLNDVDDTHDSSLAEISATVSGLKAELQKMIDDAINGVADRYETSLKDIDDAIKGIQDAIADQYALLWDKIGREDLAIEGTIVSVINSLLSGYGTLAGQNETLNNILEALRNDLEILRSDFVSKLLGDDSQGVSLASLRKSVDELNDAISQKASETDMNTLLSEANALTAAVQEQLSKYILSNDEALKDYLTKEAAGKTYALAADLSALQASLSTLETGEGGLDEYASWEGSVLEMLNSLNVLVGVDAGGFTGTWTDNLTDAVNKVYELVGTKLDDGKARETVQNLVAGIIKDILGEEGSAEDVNKKLKAIASSISTLRDSINGLDTKIGDVSLFVDSDDPDIAVAIAHIKAVLGTLDSTYAAKTHTHSGKDIVDLAEAISSEIDNITGLLADLKTTAKETLVAAINELHDKFGDFKGSAKTGEEGVDALLSDLEAVLAAAIMDGTGLDGYFASLNLTALKKAIDDIVESDGTIDTRVKAAMDALNITQYLEDSGIAAYDYVSKKEETVQANLEILSALAALKVTIGEDVFEYGRLDDAIKAVYDALNGHIAEFNEISGTYSDIESRLSAVEDLIGEGFSASNTVSSVLSAIAGTADGLDGLFKGLGANQTVKSLTDELRGLFDALINALVGKTSGGSVSDIDSSNNLNALKDALDKLSFDTIKKDGQSISDVLEAITGRVAALETTMGTGSLGTGKNVIDELKRLSDALGTFKNSEYSQWTSDIDNEIQSILNRLVGNNGASIQSLDALMDSLDDLKDRFDNFQNVTGNNFENVINGLCDNLDLLQKAVGKKDIFGDDDDFKNIADEIAAVRKYVDNFKIDFSSLGGIFKIIEEAFNYAVCIARINGYKAGTGIYTDNGFNIFDIVGLGRYTDPDLGLLNTTDKSDFVSAVNELFDSLAPFDVALEKLNAMKEAVIGGGNYISLKAIAAVYELLRNELGSKPGDFAAADIYSAIQALGGTASSLADMLGENKTDYPDVWTAINDLRSQLAARSINSLVYVPEYDDGTADADTDGSSFTVELEFEVNAPAALADFLASGSLPVKGLLRTPSSSGLGTEINGTAVYAEGILSASFFAHQSLPDGSSLALMIGSPSTGFISQYVPLVSKRASIKRIDSADPESGTVFKFLSGFGDAYSPVITLKPVYAGDDLSDIKGTERIDNLELIENGLVRTIKASKGITRGGTVSFSDNVNTFAYTVQVSSLSGVMTLNGISYSGSNNRFYADYSSSVTITFDDLSEYGLSGTLSASAVASSRYSDFINPSSVEVNGNVISFNTLPYARNTSRRSVLTVKVGNVTLFEYQVRTNQ